MRSKSRTRAAFWCFFAASAIVWAARAEEIVKGHVFRSDSVGFTYTFPEKFSPKVENEIRPQDPSGREHIILALWSAPERSGVPRIAFLYDRKVRPLGLTREEMADHYLEAVKQLWVNVRGVKISGPTQIAPAGYPIWRLDLWQPDASPHYNAAIAIPQADRRILVIQVNAPSQSELDEEVESLRQLRFDRN